jgi:hypothetical protein
MLAIEAQCRAGHIELPRVGTPRDGKVIVLFLDADGTLSSLTEDQQAALKMQSESGFAKKVLMDPAEDCWNDV